MQKSLNDPAELLGGAAFASAKGKYRESGEFRWDAAPLRFDDARAVVIQAALTGWLPERIELVPCNGSTCLRALHVVRPVTAVTGTEDVTSSGGARLVGGKGVAARSMPTSEAEGTEGTEGTAVNTALPVRTSAEQDLVDAVVLYWRRVLGGERKATARDEAAVLQYVRAGYTCDELCNAVKATLEPGVVEGRAVPRLATILRSEAKVRKWLGLPPRARETWLTAFDLRWRARYKGTLPFGVASRELKPLIAEHGLDAVLLHFQHYIDATPGGFTSLPKFATTFGTWAAPGGERADRRGAEHVLSEKPVTVRVF